MGRDGSILMKILLVPSTKGSSENLRIPKIFCEMTETRVRKESIRELKSIEWRNRRFLQAQVNGVVVAAYFQ